MLNREEVAEILAHWDQFKWEVQGFGMMRTYDLDGDGEPRLQVWDQRLAVWGNGAIHDHPWNFTSRIIAGTLFNQRFDRSTRVRADGMHYGLYKELMITPGKDGGAQDEEPQEIYLTPEPVEMYSAGEEYKMGWQELHITRYAQGTVTMIERERTRGHDTASSIWPADNDVPWKFFRPRPAKFEECCVVLGDCLKTWWL